MKPDKLQVAILSHMSSSYGGFAYFQGLIPALGKYVKDAEFTILTAGDSFDSAPAADNIRFKKLQFPKRGGRYVRLLWEQSILPRELSNLNVDVIYTATNTGVLSTRKPCVIAIRNMDPLERNNGPESFIININSRLRGAMANASISKATRIVAVSDYVKKYLVRRGVDEGKIDVIYHGIDDLPPAVRQTPGNSAPQQPYVFAASKFIRYANLDTLVRAYHQMRQFGFNGKLILAGGSLDYRYEREVRALAADLGLASHIEFLGYTSREHVQRMINNCSVFLHASKLEACPFALLEAMKQEAPIVTTTAGPMKEICGNAAIYADPDDHVSFAKAAYEIYTSTDTKESLRKNAKARASQFTWEKSAKQLITTLQKAANSAA